VVAVFAVIGALLIFAIAAAFVGSATFRLANEPVTAVFDVDEAVQSIAEALAPEHSSRLSFDEVRQIVIWYLDDLDARGLAPRPGEDVAQGDTPEVVVADDDAVARVLGRVERAGLDVEDHDVFAVIALLMGHLSAIGAVGPPAEET
jgi:hypothetical protein